MSDYQDTVEKLTDEFYDELINGDGLGGIELFCEALCEAQESDTGLQMLNAIQDNARVGSPITRIMQEYLYEYAEKLAKEEIEKCN